MTFRLRVFLLLAACACLLLVLAASRPVQQEDRVTPVTWFHGDGDLVEVRP